MNISLNDYRLNSIALKLDRDSPEITSILSEWNETWCNHHRHAVDLENRANLAARLGPSTSHNKPLEFGPVQRVELGAGLNMRSKYRRGRDKTKESKIVTACATEARGTGGTGSTSRASLESPLSLTAFSKSLSFSLFNLDYSLIIFSGEIVIDKQFIC